MTRCRARQPCGSWCYQQSLPTAAADISPGGPHGLARPRSPCPWTTGPGVLRQLASAPAEACNRSQASRTFAFLAGRQTSGEWSPGRRSRSCATARGAAQTQRPRAGQSRARQGRLLRCGCMTSGRPDDRHDAAGRRGRAGRASPTQSPARGSAGAARRATTADGPAGPGSDDPGARAPGCGGGAGGEAELAQDVGQVPVDGVLAQHQPPGDVLVAQSLRDELEHVELPRR